MKAAPALADAKPAVADDAAGTDAAAEEGPAALPGSRQRPMSVSQAVRKVRSVIEAGTGTMWIEGEAESVSRASSGHIYFALKDEQCQVRAVIWRSAAQRLRFRMETGQKLLCRGRPNLYERDGKFQFYVEYAEPAGLGAEALALMQLKRKLEAEGLFDPARKRPLPALPRRIGVVTSKSGAAVRDIIRTVQRRFPVPILVADAAVQGASAPAEIVRAIRAICQTDVDVLIVGRGGGAASDLAAFNDEGVVRAIAACPVPTISAVGHEVDFSLADLAADHRAATPTAAGEMSVPVLGDLAALLDKEERRLHREMQRKVQDARQTLDQWMQRAQMRMERGIGERRRRLAEVHARLEARHPRAQLARERAQVQDLYGRLDTVMRRRLDRGRRDLAVLAAELRSLSPLQVLERGYAIARGPGGVVTAAEQVAVGDAVSLRLARGAVDCRVEAVHPAGASGAAAGRAGDDS